MRILIFCSSDHFHSPLVLREIGRQRKQDTVFVITTPKLNPQHNKARSVYKLLRESGHDYLFSMIIAKTSFIVLALLERFVFFKNLNERKFFTVSEAIKYFVFKHYKVKNINSRFSADLIKGIKPDIIVAVFFNQIIKQPVLSTAKLCINVHPSFLPGYRGFSPVFWALANNEEYCGASVHIIQEGIDSGPVILREKVFIDSRDSFFSLYRKCSLVGARLLIKTLQIIESGNLVLEKQAEDKVSYYSNISVAAVKRFRKNKRKFFLLT